MRRRRAWACALLALLLFAGCRAAPPQIDALEWELSLIENPADGSVAERLALFLLASDPDGEDDPEELFLSHPGERLYWRFAGGEWERRMREGGAWIGSSRIGHAGGLPRGEYEVLLIDRAGKEARERLYIGLPAAEELKEEREFPRLSLTESGFLVETNLPGTALITGEDGEGRVVVALESEARRIPRGSFGIDPGAVSVWYLSLYDPELGLRLTSGPFRF